MSRRTSRTRKRARQLTIRFDPDVDVRIREVARTEGLSLNQAAVRLLRKGAGLEAPRAGDRRIGHALDRFIGTMSAEEARQIDAACEQFEVIDEEMWR